MGLKKRGRGGVHCLPLDKVLLQSLCVYVYLPLCEGIFFGELCVSLCVFAFL